MSELAAFGESAEMYMKTICELTVEAEVVPISTLADRLGISPISATEMVHRMRESQLVEHKRYKGVHLTKSGRIKALAIIRRHRLWENFLFNKLDMPWDDVHDLACQLEHATGTAVVNALDRFLGRPSTCPHGNPIPSVEGTLAVQAGSQLDALLPGQRGHILRIRPESKAVLSYLAAHGLKPGISIEILSIDHFAKLWTIQTEDITEIVGEAIASRIVLKLTDPSLKKGSGD
jgi:DtxR family Mn-dependent transcriptional regulator